MKKLTRQWVRKADDDLRGARKLRTEKPPLHDLVCFHCQQAGEKYLKALLQEIGVTPPRTHDLEVLLDLLLPHDATFARFRRACQGLTPYAIDFRYPGEDATASEARTRIRQAERIQAATHQRLGVKPRTAKKRKPP